MGTLTESFANLSEYLAAQGKKASASNSLAELWLTKVLKPLLPSGIRCGMGTITDIKDRQVGPIDIVASVDSFPAFSEGQATTYLADGVVFCLQVRDWAHDDLTHFGDMAAHVKKLERKKKTPIPCLAVGFDLLPLAELTQYLNGKSGQAIDGIFSLGHHTLIRNSLGWYGDPKKVPFVSEHPGPEAMKAFTFFLLQLSQTALGQSFGLADYQHL